LYFWYHNLPVNSDEWYFPIQQTLLDLDLQIPAVKKKMTKLVVSVLLNAGTCYVHSIECHSTAVSLKYE